MSCQSYDEPFFVPTYLFTYTAIVTLKLEGPFILPVPSSVQLPSLKSLHLNVRKCEPSCGKFLSGSPSLEVFYLKEGEGLEIERNSRCNHIVSNNQLHKLVIESDPGYDYVQDYLEGHLENVVKAKVYIKLYKVSSQEFPILKAICNVELLSLWDWNQSMVDYSSLDFHQFPNLIHLELHLESDVVSLPITLFTCTTVVILKIAGWFILPVPSYVQLPSLKSLHLEVLKCEPSYKEFLYGSPVLEVFYLKQWYDGFEELRIERNSLGNFIFSKSLYLNLVIQSDRGCDYVQDYLEGHLENIVKAKVSMTLHSKPYQRYIVQSRAFSILKSIRNVEYLSLNDAFKSDMYNLSHHDHDLPQFPNLVGLDLHVTDLDHSPYLKLADRALCPKLEKYWLNDRREL
ncbi:uncharacterized protein LOC130728031 [Lotus japonicus]|uniref:uncharacterized protein LOC130728031 n=1 Tax=Lotus japonicus TaxID=34305 RepID=UPI0025900FED|nr:uncharacterized protein LOC130728031 [Lotus japonicus]